MKLISILFWCIFLAAYQIGYAQSDWQQGAFNVSSGQKYSKEIWKSLLPDEFDLFGTEAPLEITLESDFRKLIKEKNADQYQEALLEVPLSDTVIVRRIVRIKPRGVFRRGYCSPPPIKLNFKKTKLYVNSLQQLEKMKMVSQCKNSKVFEEYVLREYLTYKLYELFTDLSFKSRLLSVTFIDTGGKKVRSTSSFAFLLEEADDLAKRTDLNLMKIDKATQSNIIDKNMALVAMFQYMIGNTDWSVPGPHNMKILKEDDPLQNKVHLVAYDFDYSGVVNTSYAIPFEKFGIANVRERLFRCKCYSEEVFQETIDFYLSRKADVYSTIREFPYLSQNAKKDIAKYIDGFYKQLEGKSPLRYFTSHCGRLL